MFVYFFLVWDFIFAMPGSVTDAYYHSLAAVPLPISSSLTLAEFSDANLIFLSLGLFFSVRLTIAIFQFGQQTCYDDMTILESVAVSQRVHKYKYLASNICRVPHIIEIRTWLKYASLAHIPIIPICMGSAVFMVVIEILCNLSDIFPNILYVMGRISHHALQQSTT